MTFTDFALTRLERERARALAYAASLQTQIDQWDADERLYGPVARGSSEWAAKQQLVNQADVWTRVAAEIDTYLQTLNVTEPANATGVSAP